MLLGNLNLVGVSWVNAIPADATIDVLAKLGAVLLLFEVGLESTVGDIMKVGGRAFIVATLGVVTPWILGWGVGAWFLPNSSGYVHAFLGATLTATSVGITARVLSDMGRAIPGGTRHSGRSRHHSVMGGHPRRDHERHAHGRDRYGRSYSAWHSCLGRRCSSGERA